MNRERDFVRMRGAPDDDPVQLGFFVAKRCDLNQFFLNNIGFSHPGSSIA
jgi:hypothetical protein